MTRAARNGNGIARKITFGILVAGFIISISAVVWDASYKSSIIAANREKIEEIKPTVEASKDDIIGMKKDLEFLSQIVADNSVAIQQSVILQSDTNKKFEEILTELRKR